MEDRKVLILPGYSAETDEDKYRRIGDIFSENGIEPEYIDIEWDPNLDRNVEKTEEIFRKKSKDYSNLEIYLFGHSWGAVCAFAASPEIEPKAQILASLSPEFREDWERFPESQKKLGKFIGRIYEVLGKAESVEDSKRPSYTNLEEENLGEIHFIYAESEYNGWFGINMLGYGGEITENRKKIFPEAQEKVVENSGHRMSSEAYFEEIRNIVENL